MTVPQTKSAAALDVGDKRIGVAIASLVARLPQPYGVINNDDQAASNIKKLIAEQNIEVLVIGLPRGLDGQDTAQTKLVQQFKDNLKKEISIPIYWQDEALTSKQAHQELGQKGLYNKEAVDALAATYILSDFFAQHPEIKQ
jgi:putative holliday junction resolvase